MSPVFYHINADGAMDSGSALYGVLEILTSLENRDGGSGNLDSLTGLGIETGSGGAALALKGAKAYKLHLIARGDSGHDRIESALQSGGCLLFGHAHLFSHFVDQILLFHILSPSYLISAGICINNTTFAQIIQYISPD